MRLLLDPSALIDVLRLHHGRRELLAELAPDGHTLATTALNVAERMRECRRKKSRGLRTLSTHLTAMT
jgi:hypothetical protein